jgi:hypothetical protein
MNWDQINLWFDAFYEEVVEGRVSVRGRTWSGARIEIYGKNDIAVVLLDPRPRGITEQAKAADFVKGIFDNNHKSLHAEIKFDRFQRVINGEEPLTEKDWVWPDE